MHIEKQRQIRNNLRELLSPFTQELNLYISGFEFTQDARGMLLRIYIDGEEGVTIDQCAKLTKDFSPILDAEDPIIEAYTLEVSSPGLDRVIETMEDFHRFQGFHVRIKRVAYKSKLDGILQKTTDEGIEVQTAVDTRFIQFDDIALIRLNPTDEEIEKLIQGA